MRHLPNVHELTIYLYISILLKPNCICMPVLACLCIGNAFEIFWMFADPLHACMHMVYAWMVSTMHISPLTSLHFLDPTKDLPCCLRPSHCEALPGADQQGGRQTWQSKEVWEEWISVYGMVRLGWCWFDAMLPVPPWL
jgi:hypothetical protein